MKQSTEKITKEDRKYSGIILGVTTVALITAAMIRADINRRPIINNFYILDDKILPIRFR